MVVEKSRDMGVSWLTLGWMFWHWLFDPSFQGLVGSRKEDYVDNRQLDSLFGKLDYFIERLPGWMLGKFTKADHRAHMKLQNPNNKNAIIGESANRDFSRSGRYGAILLDEFSFWENASSVWKATRDSTPCRIPVSTSNGMGNKFYEIVRGINKGELNIPKKRLHWSLHPHKTKEWYENECRRSNPIEIAQELDISYENSVKGRVYDNFSIEKNVVSNLTYDPHLPLYVSWDFGIGDPTALIWYQKDFDTNEVFIIDAYQRENKEISFFVPFITGVVKSGIHRYTQDELSLIKKHEAWGPAIHYGDPTGGNRTQTTGHSVISELADHGIYVHSSYKKFKITARYTDTYQMINRLKVGDHCEEFIEAILNSRWNLPEDEMAPHTKNIEPLHDWTSHFRTSLEFWAVNEPNHHKEKRYQDEREENKISPKYQRGAWWSGKAGRLSRLNRAINRRH